MAELLLELLSEEIPSRMQKRAADDLHRLVTDKLRQAGLSFGKSAAYVTPRRLTLVVDGLPERQPEVTEEKKGPRVGSPEQALQGFMKANNLASIDQAEVRETDKGKFYFLVRHREGQATARVLIDVLQHAIEEMSWPKSMRWNGYGFRWIRPLRNILAVLDGKPIELVLDLTAGESLSRTDPTSERSNHTACSDRHGAMNATCKTWGHRFLAPGPLEVTSFDDYMAKLRGAKVLLDPAERSEAIVQQARALVEREGLSVRQDRELLDEVVGLVEWPVVLMGTIGKQFMTLPPEVLTTVMRSHQRYIALIDQTGSLADRFLVVANMEAGDAGRTIVAGNERVLRARLADAEFFWNHERERPLAERVPALQGVVFHAKLGSLHHKVDRMEALAEHIASLLPGVSPKLAGRAARLCKADLTTGMVGEFPELQGVIGRYYANHDGEPSEVSDAIAEHYSPAGPDDACPAAPVSVVVALADKIDTLASFFSINERPTGSKDPYALRRAALGIIRLIVENELRLPLGRILAKAYDLQREQAKRGFRDLLMASNATRSQTGAGMPDIRLPLAAELASTVLEFLADRLKVALREKGVRHDLISAVFAVKRADGTGEDDLMRLLARVRALGSFLESDDGANLLTAYRRAANIVRIEAKKDGREYRDVDPALFDQKEEGILWTHLHMVQDRFRSALESEDFTAAMTALAELRAPIDAFFDQVTVNTEERERRANRLALLHAIVAVMNQVADFSRIEGERAP